MILWAIGFPHQLNDCTRCNQNAVMLCFLAIWLMLSFMKQDILKRMVLFCKAAVEVHKLIDCDWINQWGVGVPYKWGEDL